MICAYLVFDDIEFDERPLHCDIRRTFNFLPTAIIWNDYEFIDRGLDKRILEDCEVIEKLRSKWFRVMNVLADFNDYEFLDAEKRELDALRNYIIAFDDWLLPLPPRAPRGYRRGA